MLKILFILEIVIKKKLYLKKYCKSDLTTYYNVGKLLKEAGKHYGEGIIKEYSIKLIYELNIENIDFLKVGHHGSNTSSNIEFINTIKPKYSLISVGENNRYGHPKGDVLDILSKSKIYRTDINGEIKINIKRNNFNIKTCK